MLDQVMEIREHGRGDPFVFAILSQETARIDPISDTDYIGVAVTIANENHFFSVLLEHADDV